MFLASRIIYQEFTAETQRKSLFSVSQMVVAK